MHRQSKTKCKENFELFFVTCKMNASVYITCYTQGNTDICMLINCRTAGKIPTVCLPCRV